MKNFLLLAGVVSLMISSPAQAERYYRGDDGYYYVESVAQPKVQYIEEGEYYERESPRYSEPKYTRSSTRYQRVNTETARQYQERQAYKEDYSVNKVRPYIGFDIGRTYSKWAEEYEEDEDDGLVKDKNNSISGVIGLKFNKNFGIEAFYQQSDKAKKSVGYDTFHLNTSWQYKAYGVDFLGYLPVSQDFELLASLGLAQYDIKAKDSVHAYGIDATFSEKYSEDSLGYRLGLGLQYNINQHLALRAMAHYIQLDKDEDIKHLTEISLGLRYMF
jgi:opacity protein-like surface antigen